MKILIAVDGSFCSYAAVKEIAARPWPAGSEIKIIAVIERALTLPPGVWAFPDSYAVQIEKFAREYLSGVVNHAATKFNAADGPPIKVAAEVLSGEPKEIILDEAERWGADLIVVGSHGRRGLKRLWLGSVSQAVVSRAKCSVEIVRCPKENAGQGA
ncbi:MAG TPA: universal stress protein [Blastocatellia bacterium]|nr:universal stress protein [Blastocatellia bacterium]